jgi:hypothetical protein
MTVPMTVQPTFDQNLKKKLISNMKLYEGFVIPNRFGVVLGPKKRIYNKENED